MGDSVSREYLHLHYTTVQTPPTDLVDVGQVKQPVSVGLGTLSSLAINTDTQTHTNRHIQTDIMLTVPDTASFFYTRMVLVFNISNMTYSNSQPLLSILASTVVQRHSHRQRQHTHTQTVTVSHAGYSPVLIKFTDFSMHIPRRH